VLDDFDSSLGPRGWVICLPVLHDLPTFACHAHESRELKSLWHYRHKPVNHESRASARQQRVRSRAAGELLARRIKQATVDSD
jgi:hypothetical protein